MSNCDDKNRAPDPPDLRKALHTQREADTPAARQKRLEEAFRPQNETEGGK
jgi:hypothetical protein